MSPSRLFAVFAGLLVFATASIGQTTYARLDPPQPTQGVGAIEVTEFFSYSCPHCYRLEPKVNAWLGSLPPDVVFVRVPAVPSESWASLARIFYTLEAMKLLDKYHQKVFDAIHQDNVNLANDKLRAAWLSRSGIDVEKYAQMEKSFTVETKVQRARQMTASYKVDGVPRLVVGGTYFTTGDLAGGLDHVFPVVDQLVAMARKGKLSRADQPAPSATATR